MALGRRCTTSRTPVACSSRAITSVCHRSRRRCRANTSAISRGWTGHLLARFHPMGGQCGVVSGRCPAADHGRRARRWRAAVRDADRRWYAKAIDARRDLVFDASCATTSRRMPRASSASRVCWSRRTRRRTSTRRMSGALNCIWRMACGELMLTSGGMSTPRR